MHRGFCLDQIDTLERRLIPTASSLPGSLGTMVMSSFQSAAFDDDDPPPEPEPAPPDPGEDPPYPIVPPVGPAGPGS